MEGATLTRTLKVRLSAQRSWLHVRRVRYRLVTKAYILIDVAAGKAEEEVNSLRDLEGVLDVDQVIGQCDIIMVVNAPDLMSIGELVSKDVHNIPGVKRTVTCLVADALV